MKNITIKIKPSEALALVSALKLWGKTRYNKVDKMLAHDLIDKVYDAIGGNNGTSH